MNNLFKSRMELINQLEMILNIKNRLSSFITPNNCDSLLKPTEPDFYDVLNDLRDRFFGLTHEIALSKTIRKDRSNEALVEALINCEDYLLDKKVIHEHLDWYGFIKLVLEKDAPLFKYEECLIRVGIKRDRGGPSFTKSDKLKLSIQCAAQVLWNLDGERFPTIEAMTRELLEAASPLRKLWIRPTTGEGEIYDPKTVADWIREIFPVPKENRKEKLRTAVPKELIRIPGIFTANGVSFPKQRFAVHCLTLILKTLGWNAEQILASKFIAILTIPQPFFLPLYLRDWIIESHEGNAGILT